MLAKINDTQSIVTKKGIWLGKDWVVVNKITDENESILFREEEISRLKIEIDESERNIKSLESDLSETEDSL